MAIDSLDRVNMLCLMHDTCLCQKDVTQKPSMELKHNTKPDVKTGAHNICFKSNSRLPKRKTTALFVTALKFGTVIQWGFENFSPKRPPVPRF